MSVPRNINVVFNFAPPLTRAFAYQLKSLRAEKKNSDIKVIQTKTKSSLSAFSLQICANSKMKFPYFHKYVPNN